MESLLPCYSLHMYALYVRLKDAWSFATAIDTPDTWTELARTALKHLDTDIGLHHVLLLDTLPVHLHCSL